jgi:sporulation protein YunB
MINTIGKKASNKLLYIGKIIINNVNTNTVNNNIKIDLLKKYQIEDLININYINNEVTDIDFKLEKAYEILIDIKKEIINNISKQMNNLYNYKYEINNNTIIIEMPFYNYTNNVLLANLGPKVFVQISLVELVDGNIKTKVTTYGINSLLIELYVNITITNSILIPSINNEIKNQYEILISSKVIQGKIPSFYNGILEQSSEKLIT